MTSLDLLQQLNSEQCRAVSAPLAPVLVLAGAGSGKTRVLVHRIAWLLHEKRVSPHSILAVTFTNKAAAEMRRRIEQLLGHTTQGMWIGTFHGIAHRLLRAHWQSAKLDENFQILDSDDQHRVVRRVIRNLGLDDKQWSPKTAQWWINQQKEHGLRPGHVDDHGNIADKTFIKIYYAYEDLCKQSNLVDFTELLLRAHELLRDNPDLLHHYQQRFQHVLVDEFQDTNDLQYAWIKQLTQINQQIMVVGDDDQSIYSWRGAKIENMQRFQQDYANPLVIRLEQNYRSTEIILHAANQLIQNNDSRLGKDLWTEQNGGELIQLYSAFNELDEARFIASRVNDWQQQGIARRDIAILYRSNAQSRVLEEAFLQMAIPYRIYGGLRFFERAEIKDALAYLRLISNGSDDASFERVVNVPTRGIGEKTVQAVRDQARLESCSMWAASLKLLEQKALSSRAHNALQVFIDLILKLRNDVHAMDLTHTAQHVIEASGLLAHYQNQRGEKAQAKVENLQELMSATREFTLSDEEVLDPLNAFLVHAALEAGENQGAPDEDCVQLMTLHAAKGLEFPIVIISGFEEGLFPHYMVYDDPQGIEEERRLCYVGMTRAEQRLLITYAQRRRLKGEEKNHRPSRFLRELPKEGLEEVRLFNSMGRTTQSIPTASTQAQEDREGLHLGQQVNHPHFGPGVITSFEGRGAHTRVEVAFNNGQSKWLVLSFAKLQPA